MNVGMPQYGMPFGASSGAPYFNGWSPYGGFASPQGGYGMSSPFGGFGGGYGMPSPFGGFGGGYGMPFQQMPMGGGKGGYSFPFSQFQTPNFAAKGGTTQPQSPPSNIVGHATGLPTNSGPPPIPSGVGAPPLNLGGGNYGQNPFGGLPTTMFTGSGTGPAAVPQSPTQPAPIPQSVPPQMMRPISGPAQMLPQQTFNQNRFLGINPTSPKMNFMLGGYR